MKDQSFADLERAKADSERARRQLISTAETLQQRVKPATIAHQVWSEVRDKGDELAGDAVEAVKARPAAAAAVVGAFFLYLARGQIASAASGLLGRRHRDDDAPQET